MKLTSLPSVKLCGENLLKDNLSEDEVVRNFLTVALVSFLCPNSCTVPSTEYLGPLVDVTKAKEWDWSNFVHYWLFKQIEKYHKLMKKTDHASITMGGCLHIVCVGYLDFLNMGQLQLPPTFPRIRVWNGDMIKDKAKLDHVHGHIYGKHAILPLKSTCYYKKPGSRTPSPTCDTDVLKFRDMLAETVQGTLSPKIMDDVSALYMKHAVAYVIPAADNIKTIIVDVINYFYEQAQAERNAPEQHAYVPDDTTGNLNIRSTELCSASKNMEGNGVCEQNSGAASGDTILVPSTAGDCSLQDSVPETEKVSSSLNGASDQFNSSQGVGSQAKRRRVSNSPSNGNNANVHCHIAGRTRSRRSSISPELAPSSIIDGGFVDNPEAILRRKNVKRTTSRAQSDPDLNVEVNAAKIGILCLLFLQKLHHLCYIIFPALAHVSCSEITYICLNNICITDSTPQI